MIPMPRPSLPFGACQRCGRLHIESCVFGPRDFLEWYRLHVGDPDGKAKTATEHLRRLEEEELRLMPKYAKIKWRTTEPRWGTP